MTKKLFLIVLILGILGLIDASYLTVQHYGGAPLACSVFSGCDRVTSSAYATWGSVPVALVGVLYYAGILVTATLAFLKNKRYFFLMVGITVLGSLVSLWFLYLQLFTLDALCTYCLASALITFILAGVSMSIRLLEKRAKTNEVELR